MGKRPRSIARRAEVCLALKLYGEIHEEVRSISNTNNKEA